MYLEWKNPFQGELDLTDEWIYYHKFIKRLLMYL